MTDATPSPVASLPPGTSLGEFELLRVVGVGGTSFVYLAHDHSLQRQVALKEYLPGALAMRTGPLSVAPKSMRHAEAFEAGLRSFINEARLLARFDHPSLIRVHRFWEANGTAYMVMPFIEGGRTLKEVLRERGEAPDEAFLTTIASQVGGALSVLHAEQVYHRDVAPDNLMQLANGRWLLLDFGAARRVIGDLTSSLTVILKPGYAPVEQYAEVPGMAQGPWTDVYALGAVLHYAITGQTPPASVGRMLDDSYRPLAEVAAGRYSPGFLAAIDHALALKPADRPGSIGALLQAMGGAAASEPGAESAGLARPQVAGPQLPALRAPLEVSAASPLPAARGGAWGAVLLAPLGAVVALPMWLWRAFVSPWGHRPSVAASVPNPAPTPAPPPATAASDGHTVIQPRRTAAPAPVPASTAAGLDAGHTVILGQPRQPAPETPALVQIVVSGGSQRAGVQQVYRVRSATVRIGRRDSADLRLHDSAASAEHAVIEHADGGWFVTDQGSSNGTFLGQRRLVPLQREPLWLGASLQIGDTLLTFTQSADAVDTDHSGGRIGGLYLLQRRLRNSPKGAVYAATQLRTGSVVALKLLAPEVVGFAAYRAQFAGIVAAARQLQHPHICPLLDSGWDTIVLPGGSLPTAYLAYPLLTGGNLADRIADRQPVSHVDAQRWLVQVAAALSTAHRQGLVHGDLKPSAVCFDAEGQAYVTDFALGPGRSGTLLGSPPYMSPEQWKSTPPGPRTDLFALAAIAYTLLTGAPPFEGQADPLVRERNFRLGPVEAHEEAAVHGRAPLSPLVSAVLRRALATRPDQRHDSVQDFVDELTRALAAGPGAALPQVFLSYRRGAGSTPVAHVLRRELIQQHRIACFLDVEEGGGAGSFPEGLASAIADCRVFVCLLSEHTLASEWVRREVEIAHGCGRPMIPVLLESYRPPEPALAQLPAIDALLHSKGESLSDARGVLFDEGMARVVNRVRETLSRPRS